MTDVDPENFAVVLRRIRDQARSENLRITQHAHQEMVAEDIALDQLREAIETSELLENYPQHQRGACCLLAGQTSGGRPLHVVCTTAQPVLIIITVYEPKPPKWVTPKRRSARE